MILEQIDKKRNKQKIVKVYCSFWAPYIAENNVYSIDTFNSLVAAWIADHKDPGSILLCILIFPLYFKSERCWFKSREQ